MKKTEQMEQEKKVVKQEVKVVLNEEQANLLLNYLSERPYKESYSLIQMITESVVQ